MTASEMFVDREMIILKSPPPRLHMLSFIRRVTTVGIALYGCIRNFAAVAR